MSDTEPPEEGTKPLTEAEERLLDYDVVAPAFIRHTVHSKLESVPRAILDLCTKFVKPVVFENESDDPVNFISDHDETQCDRYKEEGNEYFRSKEYELALMKYATALRM